MNPSSIAARQTVVRLDPLSLGPLVHALACADTLRVSGSGSGRLGDRVTVIVNNVPFHSTLSAEGRFTVAVPVEHLMASSAPSLSAVMIATDDQGTPAAACDAWVLPIEVMQQAWGQRGQRGQSHKAKRLAGVSHHA